MWGNEEVVTKELIVDGVIDNSDLLIRQELMLVIPSGLVLSFLSTDAKQSRCVAQLVQSMVGNFPTLVGDLP